MPINVYILQCNSTFGLHYIYKQPLWSHCIRFLYGHLNKILTIRYDMQILPLHDLPTKSYSKGFISNTSDILLFRGFVFKRAFWMTRLFYTSNLDLIDLNETCNCNCLPSGKALFYTTYQFSFTMFRSPYDMFLQMK